MRRPLAAALGVAIGFALAFGSWAAIGFAGLGDYPELLSKVGEQENYSLVAVAEELGLRPVGAVVAALVGGALLVAAVSVVAQGAGDRARSRSPSPRAWR